jgi:MoaA/NifB/PqqE/SkfB family radical SAM enzyme
MIRAFGDVLAQYQRLSEKRVLVSWLGGEPLRWSPLEELSVHFRQTLGLGLSTTTNGTTLHNPRCRAHLLEFYDELTISVDGLGDVHDRLRGWSGGFDTLRCSVRTLVDERGAASLRIRMNVVLQRETITVFSELCRELATWGVDEITFNQLGGRDRPEYFPANRLLPEQVERFRAELPFLRKELRGVRLAGSEAYLDRFAASARDERLAFPDCEPGGRFLFVDERGLVAPCSFTTDRLGVPISQLRTLDELVRVPATFHQLRQSKQPAPCADCHSTQVFAKFAA